MRETISIHGVELLSPPSSTTYKNAFKYMIEAHKLLHKLEGRGRPHGPRGFRDEEELLDTTPYGRTLETSAPASGTGS